MRPGKQGQSLYRVAWLAGAVCCFASCLFALACSGKGNSATPRAESGGAGAPVAVATVTQKDVPINIQVIGSVEASLTVTIKPQVSGELTRVYFREGDFVKKGDPLFEIDKRMLDSQLNQSQANLAKDEAQLALAQANLKRDEAQEKYALAEADRYQRMLKDGLVTLDEAELVKANTEARTAAVNADKAAIQGAQAAVNASRASVENARVLLGYTTIVSPLGGRTGSLHVQQGNVVTANATNLITINQVEPVYVTFSAPETQLPMLRTSQHVTVTSRDDSERPKTGSLTFIDNAVDPATGTIRLKATFENSDHSLWPGEFVRVALNLAVRPNALVVPSQAMQTGQNGPYVIIVKPDRTVEFRPVVIGPRIDQELVIEQGLQAGETVVTEGQLRLAPGSRVRIGDNMGSAAKEEPAGQ